MRSILILFCFALMSTDCDSKKSLAAKQQKENSIIFIYKQYTRGFYREYHFQENGIKIYSKYGADDFEEMDIIPIQWTVSLNLLNDIDLVTINQLEPPSSLRHTDRVHHAELSIVINGNTFRSSNFDHQNPPKAIKLLVDHLVQMVRRD